MQLITIYFPVICIDGTFDYIKCITLYALLSSMMVRIMVFNATFNYISVISWGSVLLEFLEKTTYICPQKGRQAIFNIFYTRQKIQSKCVSVNILTYNVCTFSNVSSIGIMQNAELDCCQFNNKNYSK
jgi:hypothetical protein